jgi:EAL domain-containing protein (putative c-di-GMP-specific phosphodiesterase class I)
MAIIEGLVEIARKLDIRLIAEGIETEEQARTLQAAGCVLGQGYLFSRAVDRHATTRLLIDRAQRRSRTPVLPQARLREVARL